MKNKICVVSGANSGIGKITALALAEKGANIVMVCRNEAKGKIAREEIIRKTNNQNIDLLLCDFSSQIQIRKVAQEFNQKYTHLDVLVNNAGLMLGKERKVSEDGIEMTFAINHLGYFLLTNLLLDALKKADKARIVSVSSYAHYFAKPDFDNLQLEQGYTPLKAYAISKLGNILFTFELAKRLKDSHITVNCLHPGGVATNFANDSTKFFKFLFKIGKPFLISAIKGAATSIYLATSPDIADITGKYFEKKKIKKPSKFALDEKNWTKMWEISAKLCNLNFER